MKKNLAYSKKNPYSGFSCVINNFVEIEPLKKKVFECFFRFDTIPMGNPKKIQSKKLIIFQK